MNIKVIAEELKERSDTLNKYISEDDAIIQKLTNLILNIDDVWQGEAQSAFLGKFQSSKNELKNLKSALSTQATFIKDVANQIEKLDNDLSREIRNIN